jgi:hypothetical protein
MKAISTVTPVLLALFLAAACGDDDDSTGGGTMTKCKVPYEDKTAVSLKAGTATTGKCASDIATICGTNMISVASSCGVSCKESSDVPAEQLACAKKCIQMNASPSPSDDCTSCYVADVACSIQFCLTECISAT